MPTPTTMPTMSDAEARREIARALRKVVRRPSEDSYDALVYSLESWEGVYRSIERCTPEERTEEVELGGVEHTEGAADALDLLVSWAYAHWHALVALREAAEAEAELA